MSHTFTTEELRDAFTRWHRALTKHPENFIPDPSAVKSPEFGEQAADFLVHLLEHPKALTGGKKTKK